MSKGTVEIPIEVWEHCQQDAERMAYLHKECIKLQAENERLRKAGNAIALLHSPNDRSPERIKYECLLAWADAVEGLDAK